MSEYYSLTILIKRKLMEKVENKCIICNSKATRKLHDESGFGFFLICEKDVCEDVLLKQLSGALKNQN